MSDIRFDYVVVGAGSAGCALAARLSEDPACEVLLVEAGGRDGTPLFSVPGAQVFVKDWARYAWLYDVEPDATRGERREVWRRGRILGGSSTINGLIWAQGLPSDFDGWASSGLTGWGWRDVAPYFRRCESFAGACPGDGRGTDGPVHVEHLRSPHALTASLIESCATQGMQVVGDINGASVASVGFAQTNQRRGRRCSSSMAYLAPARRRRNLTVWTRTPTRRVLFEGTRAVGVEVLRGGAATRVSADREVIVCAGAIASPQLLMLSGVGPGRTLQRLGVPVVADSPNVGSGLHDHPELYIEYEVDMPTYTSSLGWRSLTRSAWDYLRSRSGPAISPATHLLGYARSGYGDDPQPDILLFAGPWGPLDTAEGLSRAIPVFSISPSICRPRSRGSVSLRSADPRDPPLIDARLLEDDDDVRRLAAGVRLVDRIARSGPFARHVRRRLTLPEGLDDDAALQAHMRHHTGICYHAAGTCRMGAGADAVLDASLRVRGVQQLRVADASAMPLITSGNLNAPSTMIGERAADFVRGENR
jgi:choline dehydrogenase